MATNAASSLGAVKSLVETIVPWHTWLEEQKAKAAKIALCRKYADGEHRSGLTSEMRNMLRIAETAHSTSSVMFTRTCFLLSVQRPLQPNFRDSFRVYRNGVLDRVTFKP